MKKQLIMGACLLAAMPAWASGQVCGTSKNLASPFYMPQKNQWAAEVEGDMSRAKINPVKGWSRGAEVGVEYGVTDDAAVFVTGGNDWTRTKAFGLTEKEHHNENWSIGGKYNLFSGSFPILATVQYLQDRRHGVQGEYKALFADVKKDFCTCCSCDIDTYVGASIEVPVFQSSNSDNEPKYSGYAGIFRPWTQWFATDIRGIYSYNSEGSVSMPSVYGAVSVLPVESIAISLFAEQGIGGRAKNHTNVHEQEVGLNIKVQF